MALILLSIFRLCAVLLSRRDLRHRARARGQFEGHGGAGSGRVERTGGDLLRIRECVDGFQVWAGEGFTGDHARRRGVAPIEHEFALVLQVAVQHKDTDLVVLRIGGRGDIHKRHIVFAESCLLKERRLKVMRNFLPCGPAAVNS